MRSEDSPRYESVRGTAKRLFSEMPTISRAGKVVLAGDKPLRDTPLDTASSNIVVFYSSKASFMLPAGFMMCFFMDSEESAEAMRTGQINYGIWPPGRRSYDMGNPISDVWRAGRFDKRILGAINGVVDDKEIYIDKMSVRPGFKRASINSKMIDKLKDQFPGRTVNYSGVTRAGAAFVKKYTGQDWKPAHGERPEF